QAESSFTSDSVSCVKLACTGDSLDVEPEMRHKCVPRFYDTCPTVGSTSHQGLVGSGVLSAAYAESTVVAGAEDVQPTFTLVRCKQPLLLRVPIVVSLR